MRDTLIATHASAQRRELEAVATETLSAIARRRSADHSPLSGFLVEAWYSLNARVLCRVDPPGLAWTWAELHPASLPDRGPDRTELNRLEEWLVLTETLVQHDPHAVRALGFYDRDQELIAKLIPVLERVRDPDGKALVESILRRIERVAYGTAVPPNVHWKRRCSLSRTGGCRRTSRRHRVSSSCSAARSTSPATTSHGS